MNMKLVKTIVGARPIKPEPKRPDNTHIVEVHGRFWLVDPEKKVGYLIGGDINDDWQFGSRCQWSPGASFSENEKLVDRPITIQLEPVS